MVKLLLFIFMINIAMANGDIENFENASIIDKKFPSIAFKVAKIYFEQRNIGKTLAITSFYRINFLDTSERAGLYFQEAIYQLEVLALSEHCQWGLIEALMKEYKGHLEHLKLSSIKWEELNKQISYSRSLRNSSNKETAAEIDAFIEPKNIFYKLDLNSIKNVEHPKHLFLKVENKCVKRF